VTLESTRRSTPASHEVVWEDLPPLADLDGTPRTREVDGREVLFCRVAGEIYAYGARCPACQADLSRGKLRGQVLVCAGCRQGYDVIHAGRATDRPDRHLDPYPIVTRDGRPQLALPALRVAAIAE
jgi:nitrite reductase/ring-hydroxylating ferredoxin subunit